MMFGALGLIISIILNVYDINFLNKLNMRAEDNLHDNSSSDAFDR
jgi:hypothetical protein